MKQVKRVVKAKQQVLGELVFDLPENLAEARAIGWDDAKILDLATRQFVTDSCNKYRQDNTEEDKVRVKDHKKLAEAIPTELLGEFTAALDRKDMAKVAEIIGMIQSSSIEDEDEN
jgi:hypothetical protein